MNGQRLLKYFRRESSMKIVIKPPQLVGQLVDKMASGSAQIVLGITGAYYEHQVSVTSRKRPWGISLKA